MVIGFAERKTLKADFEAGICTLTLPLVYKRKRRLDLMIDQVYWRLMGKLNLPDLVARTEMLNREYFGFKYQQVRYKRQFRRWGSCSSLGNINLSHRLIGAPQDLVDYVILHELAHLEQPNHSKAFWQLVKTVVPDPNAVRAEIIGYGRVWNQQYSGWRLKLAKTVK